jgi:hypothetical protein
MWIGDVDLGKNMVQRPQVVNWLSTMHHNNQGALPSQEVDEKLEEGVDCESLGYLVFSMGMEDPRHTS